MVGWLVVAGPVLAARQPRPGLPAVIAYGAGSGLILSAVYRKYAAIDRLVPGTH